MSVEGVTSHRFSVAEDDEFHAGTGNGYIHAAQIAQETYLAFIIAAHHRDEDDVTFLSLKTVNGVYADGFAYGTKCVIFLE